MNGIETNNTFIPPSSVYIHLSLAFQDPLYRVFESRFSRRLFDLQSNDSRDQRSEVRGQPALRFIRRAKIPM